MNNFNLFKILFMRILVFLFILIFNNVLKAPAQNVLLPDANETVESLTSIIDKIGKLDAIISENIYGNIGYTENKKYEDRLKEASRILDSLDAIDNKFKLCSEKNPNDIYYSYYSVLTELTALGIVANSKSYLNYLKTDMQSLNDYENKKVKWDKKEKELIKNAKAQINILLSKEKNNYYVQTLFAICNYYDNKANNAIKELVSIINNIKKEINEDTISTNKINENIKREKNLSFAQTWLGYIYYKVSLIDSAQSAFKNANDLVNSDSKSIEWIDKTTHQLKEANSRTMDMSVPDYNLPNNDNAFESKTLLFEKRNPLNNTIISGFDLIENPLQNINNQRDLIKQTINIWTQLQNMENTPWELYIKQMQQCGGKPHKKDYRSFFVTINTKNKGDGKINLSYYKQRFDTAYTILNKLFLLRQSWTNMITNNPDILLFRIYRIKVDLAIHYINDNKNTFLDFFSYYKINKITIPVAFYDKIKIDFDVNPINEINEDVNYCTKNFKNNLIFMLTKAEIAAYTEEPNNALNIINTIDNNIPDGATIGVIDPKIIIELYKSYTYFRNNNFTLLKQSAQKLNSDANTKCWSKYLTNYYIYNFENNKYIKE